MSIPVIALRPDKLLRLGLRVSDSIHYQLPADELVEHCLRRGDGMLSDTGALVINTGQFTGRSPKDRFIVRDEKTSAHIHWNDFNQPIEAKYFDIVLKKMIDYFNRLPEIWIRDCFACADPQYRMNIRVINETPWMNLFAYNMFLRPNEEALETFKPEWQVLSAPGLQLNPAECGTRQSNAVLVSFHHKLILLAGTGYTGEIKKAIFSILNYILPQEKHVLGMHCAANMGAEGDTALFFGLSGTGKTTLSTDCNRKLIGDDEHGWTANSIFNFEGGCYAKCINLKEDREPEIFQAIRPGALVENVKFYPGTNRINYDDGSITENTRVSYPLDYIRNVLNPAIGHIPKNIFFLTCDAFGVLPPIAKLSAPQAMYQFISGYTAKVAGTETGIREPKSTFSACFGAPFMPLHPGVYATMLGKKIRDHEVKVWLINTGWSSGPHGTGARIKLSATRAMITAALSGQLDRVDFQNHPVFGVAMPASCPGVEPELLNPRNTWADKQAYDEKASYLASLFINNFEKYKSGVSEEILAAGPKPLK
ncbi:MAG TPA: phosphoenolpyruvate carboxykinase (ATP) [Puia sp.]|nr:phosphoenolpyruvate carboxykinase (ATP) [Puia sp.]